jgi:hypothetical protein
MGSVAATPLVSVMACGFEHLLQRFGLGEVGAQVAAAAAHGDDVVARGQQGVDGTADGAGGTDEQDLHAVFFRKQ